MAILAINDQGEVILVKQHRQPFKEQLLEIPAGKLEPDEEPLACAKRELLEETGFVAASWSEWGCFYPSPGFCNEKIYLFLATALTFTESAGADPDENIEVTALALAEAGKMIDSGIIKDGKTMIALQRMLLKSGI